MTESAGFVRDVAAEYERRTGLVPQLCVTGASAGAELRLTQREQRNQRTSSGSSAPSG